MKRSLLLPGSILVWAVAFAAVAPGCGQQGEGERCDRLNGNDDCNTGLICTLASDLGQKSDVCCPEGVSSDRRCAPAGNSAGGAGGGTTTTTTTSTGGGGTGGSGGAGTGGTGGAGGTGGTGGI